MELNKLYNENCLDTMAQMPDNFIDLVVTSPPYNEIRNYKGYNFDFNKTASELYRTLKTGGTICWIVGDSCTNGSESGTSFKQALHFIELGLKLHDTMIYEKSGFSSPSYNRYHQVFEYMFILVKDELKTFNPIKDRKVLWNSWGKRTRRMKDGTLKITKDYNGKIGRSSMRYNIWKYTTGGCNQSSADNIAYEHPAIFPEKLAGDHIVSWSNENDLIYDPFAGSGTTLKMAHLLNRKWLGSEISPDYCEIINKRMKPYLQQLTLF
jgi:DNA modification methylase